MTKDNLESTIDKVVQTREKMWCLALLRTLNIDEIDKVLKEYIQLRDKGIEVGENEYINTYDYLENL